MKLRHVTQNAVTIDPEAHTITIAITCDTCKEPLTYGPIPIDHVAELAILLTAVRERLHLPEYEWKPVNDRTLHTEAEITAGMKKAEDVFRTLVGKKAQAKKASEN